jgi:hypothetical protein
MFSPTAFEIDERKPQRAENVRPPLEAVSAKRDEGTGATG